MLLWRWSHDCLNHSLNPRREFPWKLKVPLLVYDSILLPHCSDRDLKEWWRLMLFHILVLNPKDPVLIRWRRLFIWWKSSGGKKQEVFEIKSHVMAWFSRKHGLWFPAKKEIWFTLSCEGFYLLLGFLHYPHYLVVTSFIWTQGKV